MCNSKWKICHYCHRRQTQWYNGWQICKHQQNGIEQTMIVSVWKDLLEQAECSQTWGLAYCRTEMLIWTPPGCLGWVTPSSFQDRRSTTMYKTWYTITRRTLLLPMHSLSLGKILTRTTLFAQGHKESP